MCLSVSVCVHAWICVYDTEKQKQLNCLDDVNSGVSDVREFRVLQVKKSFIEVGRTVI